MKKYDDTIAAIATPIGVGGLSVIRISGKDAIKKVSIVFKGKHQLTDARTYTAHYGKIIGPDNTAVEEIIATVFRSPYSYTMEDIVEISCHGGYYNAKIILDIITSLGVRLAQPGEFTKRAFLNGRIDLAQAEAVSDLIRADSELYHKTALDQLEGKLSNEIVHLRDKLLNICSLLELELDFVEEDLSIQSRTDIKPGIETILNSVEKLIESYKEGKVYRDGVKVVIIGKPNVGKSSILNILLNEKRAIVTNIPGTTRDVIEESLLIDGILFRISDTAGIRNSSDPIESEGMNRTLNQIRGADIIIMVVDPTQGVTNDDYDILDISEKMNSGEMTLIIAINKTDISIPANETMQNLVKYRMQIINTSAITGLGIDMLKRMLRSKALGDSASNQERSTVIINSRHRECLVHAGENLEIAMEGLKNNMSNEFISLDLRLALDNLGDIIGLTTTDDILNSIFSNFCIGK